jgi:tRNA threonylcarbamoyl adenosine modification protein YeaZ
MAACSLVIETSTPHASISLVDAEGHVETRSFCSDRNHNAMLFEPLRELLDGSPRPETALVLVGSGPGSYSGTRVGIAAAQGVAIATGCPAVAVPSILAVPSVANGARCLAIGDARRGTARALRCRGTPINRQGINRGWLHGFFIRGTLAISSQSGLVTSNQTGISGRTATLARLVGIKR